MPHTFDSPALARLVRLTLALVLLVPAAAFAAAPGSAADVHARIARVLAAYGGRERLAKVHGYRLEGSLFSAMRHEEAPIVRVFQRPGRFKTMITYGDGAEARLVDGAQGWRADHGGRFESAEGPMLAAMVLQAARSDVPWILADRESLARVVPPLEHHGMSLEGIEVPLGDGLTLRAFVDPRTHQVMISQGTIERGPMRTHFETWYSDFRNVEGVRVPFHEDNWASGMQTGSTTVKKVVLNPVLRPDEFQPPATLLAPPRDAH